MIFYRSLRRASQAQTEPPNRVASLLIFGEGVGLYNTKSELNLIKIAGQLFSYLNGKKIMITKEHWMKHE